uniref:Uncharacterized protein n=1 Tax=Arundo donax TaxID=35708 RepID=A0A0A9CNR2_ARUDO
MYLFPANHLAFAWQHVWLACHWSCFSIALSWISHQAFCHHHSCS